MDRSSFIFNNPISIKDYKKSLKVKNRYLRKYGDDSQIHYHLTSSKNDILYPFIGVHNISLTDTSTPINLDNAIIVGNIRMGFGHYRISMAIASAAYSMGYTPYWFDLHSFEPTTGAKIIKKLNGLYSLGSRLSQKKTRC